MAETEHVAIDGYRDFVRLGAGGFATVYRAYQERFDRVVAVKVLTIKLDEKALRRFQRECQATGRLSGHPNIVTVLDSGVTNDGRPFMTTELMERGSLGDWLERHGAMPAADVLRIGVKMCGALTDVHRAGILHRDLKPPNILVSAYGEPALADFGISAVGLGELTGNTISFTPQHTAPEVLEGSAPAATMDIYSLGSTLYALAAGHPAFEMEDNEALLPFIMRILNEEVPPLPPDAAPPELTAALRTAMAKKPADRYQDAEQFGEALQEVQAALGHAITPMAAAAPGSGGNFDVPIESLLLPTPTTAVAARRSTLPIVVAAVAVAVALVAIGVVFARGSGDGSGLAAGGSGGTTRPVGPNPAPPTRGGRLTVGLPAPIPGLGPTAINATVSNMAFASTVAEALFRPAPSGYEPLLASSASANPTFTEWTIGLREGVTFHDGTQLRAASVKQSLDAFRASLAAGPVLKPITDIVAVDQRTVRIVTDQPWATLPLLLASPVGLILGPATFVDRDRFIGTGPFLVGSGLTEQGITVKRNPDYWQEGKPYLDEIEFRFVVGEQQRADLFDQGALDVFFTSDSGTITRESGRAVTLVDREALLGYVVLNTAAPPFDDLKLREALAYATDRRALAAQLGSHAQPLETWLPPGSPLASPTELVHTYQPDTARRLVAEYKAAHPERTDDPVLATIIGNNVAVLAPLLKKMWGDVGLTVKINATDQNQLAMDVIAGSQQAALASVPSPLDPDLLSIYFHSTPEPGRVSLNLSRYASPTLDAALDRARATPDRAERAEAYATVTRELDSASPYLFLVSEPFALVASSRVTGLSDSLAPGLIRGGDLRWCLALGVER